MKFERAKFVNQGGGYYSYEGKFVARFKYGRGGAGTFITFLIKNFEVEEYFEKTSGSGIENTPLKVLQAKGYLQSHIKKELKEQGYEVSVAGFEQYIKDAAENYGRETK
jgi:hypothetical protein